MAAMRSRVIVLAGGLAVASLALPGGAVASERDKGHERARPASISIDLKGVKNGKVKVGKRITAIGRVHPFVGHQQIEVRLGVQGKTLKTKTPFIQQAQGENYGTFELRSPKLKVPGKYRVRAFKETTAAQVGGKAKSKGFRIDYPDLDPGDRSSKVKLFNKLLRKRGYYTSHGKKYGSGTGRAVMAFRKVNGMARHMNATTDIFKKLADGKGAYKLRHPGAGRHVEVDMGKQVMVLAANGKPKHTFHVSTGTAATPSDPGGFTFYRKDPGYNSIGMYYSVYYNRGEAIHGYESVPPHPASHGCIRNPIPNSIFIYNWVDLGMKIWVH